MQVRLDDSIGLIDDMEETLDSMLDPKLHHMREDIAAKEARNNRLEPQTLEQWEAAGSSGGDAGPPGPA